VEPSWNPQGTGYRTPPGSLAPQGAPTHILRPCSSELFSGLYRGVKRQLRGTRRDLSKKLYSSTMAFWYRASRVAQSWQASGGAGELGPVPGAAR